MELAIPTLAVTFFRTFDRQPLAILHNLPHEAAMQPFELRALAAALTAIADDCERGHNPGPITPPRRGEYDLGRYVASGKFVPKKYTPEAPPRLRRPGEALRDYRVAMGWDAP